MKIDGWDIADADARQWNVTPGFHSVKNTSDWARGSPVPVMIKNEIGFKRIKIVLLVKKSGGRQAIIERCSEILSHLLEPVELELDWFDHKFFGVLAKDPVHNEKAMRFWHTLTLEFDCYEYAEEIPVTTSGAKTMLISNPGNILTPAIIEVTPQIGVASIVLTGICRDPNTGEDMPVTIRELVTGKTVILDGETGLITEDGKLKAKDVDIWALPALLPGDNRITLNSEWMDITVRFRPRFM